MTAHETHDVLDCFKNADGGSRKILRVMQIIYSIDPDNARVKERKVLAGQSLDVFIDVK